MAGRKRRPPAARAAATPVALAVPQVSAAQLGLEAAGGLAEGVGRLANTPVIGWERITTYTKGRRNPKSVVEKSTFEVRAWELALLGGIGLVIWDFLNIAKGTSDDKKGILGIPIPIAVQATPGASGWYELFSGIAGAAGWK